MKKTILVLLVSFMVLAAPAFAEVTASGEVNYYWMFNADDYAEAIDTNDVVLDLGATVGEYTSISAEFEAETDLSGPFVTDRELLGYDENGDAVYGEKNGSADTPVNMNKVTLTQDITGALGINGPVSVAVTFGISDFDPVEYNDLTYWDFDRDGEMDPGTIMTKASFGFAEGMNLDLVMYEDQAIGANFYGNFAGMVDLSAYYLNNFTTGSWDYSDDVPADADDPYIFGANTAVAAMEGLTVGAGFEYASWDTDTDTEYITHFGGSVVYTYDALTAGVGVWSSDSDSDAWGDFAEETVAAVNAQYALTEMVAINGAVGSVLDAGDDDFEDVVFYEVGTELYIDNVTYGAGYTLESDNWGYCGGFTDDDERAGNVYMYVKATF